jgi:Shoulder domain
LSHSNDKIYNLIASSCVTKSICFPDFDSTAKKCSAKVNKFILSLRLQLQLSYNWHFDVNDKEDPREGAKLFSVPDFIGDMCKAIASQIRGAVSAVSFDDFHKNSARIIKIAVFGVDDGRKPRDELRFVNNSLVVTSIDIRSVEPVDQVSIL